MAVNAFFRRDADAEQLLVFFHGWGMDARPPFPAEIPGTDLLVVSDYTDPPGGPPGCVRRYRRCILLAWSLGVWSAAASGWSALLPPGPRIAVNGTLSPIDAETGITPAVFYGTLANWGAPGTREKFRLRISGTAETATDRSAESQKRELAELEARITSHPNPPNPFTTAFCGRRDRIFPFPVQQRAWCRRPETAALAVEWLHDPFAREESRRELLDHVLQ